jgi:hypothetical protein
MFRCLSCPARFTSQRDLFFHLKSHYEPEADDVAIGHDDVVSYDYPAEDNYGEEELQQDLKPEIVMAPPPPKVQKISKTSLCNKYSWLSLSGEGDVQVINNSEFTLLRQKAIETFSLIRRRLILCYTHWSVNFWRDLY